MARRYLLVKPEAEHIRQRLDTPTEATEAATTARTPILRGAMLQTEDARPSSSQRGKEVHGLAARRAKGRFDGEAINGRKFQTPREVVCMTRRERDLFAQYAGPHGPDPERWTRGVWKHYQRRAIMLREGVKEILK